jgi:hypothetical protein
MDEIIKLKDLPPRFDRPHVVILGAGASAAALPNGDKQGRILPLMNNFVQVVGLTSLLEKAGIRDEVTDFERIYSKLAEENKHPKVLQEIESQIFDYFAAMQLPHEPTLYDHLLLSLREKDLIATFNWDPFLMQARRLNAAIAKMPRTVFLHGYVAIGQCLEHEKLPIGMRGERCHRCGKLLVDSKLLYPVNKNYKSSDRLIRTG